MKKNTSTLLGVVLFLLFACGSAHFATAQGWRAYFEDDFDGFLIDKNKWNTDIATSGVRWNESITRMKSWLDVSLEPWVSLPYGTITVSGGKVSFSAGEILAYPYIWRGQPSRPSPFPATGDFIYEFKWKLDSPGIYGAGIICPVSPDTDPVGDNDPFGTGGLLGFWGAGTDQWVFGSPTGATNVYDNLQYHIIRVEYISGLYTLHIDGNLVAGPTASSFRPNTIFIGNPHSNYYDDVGEWPDFSFDYVRVMVPNTLIISSPDPGYHAAIGEDVVFEGGFNADVSLGTYTGEWIFSSPTNPEIRMSATTSHIRDDRFSVSDTFQFLEVGVYSIKLVVTDPLGNTFESSIVNGLPAYLVVYDPDGGSYGGSLTISSQAEVDTFYYTEVTGDLVIEDAGIDPITNLDGLSSLTGVAGSLSIQQNDSLESIEGLISLTSVGVDLVINENASLVNLDGLSFLTSTGELGITNNAALTEFCGLYTLLDTGGLAGSYMVTGNGANPTKLDILAQGPCGNSTYEGYVQELVDDGTLNQGMTNPLEVFANQQNEAAMHSYLSALVQGNIISPLEARTLCKLVSPGDDACDVDFR